MAGNVLTITKENFVQTVASGVTLVDFWADWCGPCKMIAPVLVALADELAGTAKVGKINVDEQEALARQFSIMSIPTLIVFKDGKLMEKVSGFRQQNVLSAMIKKYL